MNTNTLLRNYIQLNKANKMKFVVDNLTKCSPRLGNLKKDTDNGTCLNIETPFAMLYTRVSNKR